MSFELKKTWQSAGGFLPSDWSIVPLESLLRDSKSIVVGVMYPGPDTPNGTPLIKVGDVRNGTVPFKPTYCISDETNEEHKRTQLIGNELLITLVGNPGECVVVKPYMAGWNPARAIAVIRLEEPNLRIYLKTVLEGVVSKHLIDSVLNTTVQKTLNLKDIRKLPIPMPPKATIDEISAIVESVDNRISLLRETNTTLEAIAQTLFKSWFVDFDPVKAKAEGRLPEGMDDDTAALFPSEFEGSALGLIPKGWRVESVGDVMDYKEGPGIRNWQYTNSDEGTKFINIRCIQEGDLSLNSANRIKNEEANGKYIHFHLKAWDVVVSTSGTLGRSAIVRKEHLPLMLNTSVIRFRPIPERMEFCFLYQHLNSSYFLFELDAMASGSVQKNFGPMHLRKMSLVCPSFDLICQYEIICKPLLQKVVDNREQIQTLTTLRDTLLPRLISGQLRLNQAQEIMDEVGA